MLCVVRVSVCQSLMTAVCVCVCGRVCANDVSDCVGGGGRARRSECVGVWGGGGEGARPVCVSVCARSAVVNGACK